MTQAAAARGTWPASREAAECPCGPPPLPEGFGVEWDPSVKQLTDSVLWGGSPVRAMRLSEAGRDALRQLREGPVRSAAAGLLARRLTDANLAHPVPPPGRPVPEVTVLIPARDRTALLDRCLAATAGPQKVIVVDDGSADPAAIAELAARHGASLLRRDTSGGPGPARNTGLAAAGTEFVAFLDSDCEPPPDWVGRLAVHFADPLVAAVAARVVAPAGRSAAARYAAACGSLDLGPRQARVVPGAMVSYVPTAALLVRRAALEQLAFDPSLRCGEDVDLVWRLHDAGWRVRYDPAVEVVHYGPESWPRMLAKRFRYGASAAPLARRHPGRLAPLALQPWPAVTVAALLARRPLAAAAAQTAGWLSLTRAVRRAGLPADGAWPATVTAAHQTWLGIGRYATQFAAPALAAALVKPGGATQARRWGRRAAVASLLLGPALDAWRQRRPELGPVSFTVAHIADDIAYGAGVWTGCARERTHRPLTPVVTWRRLRVDGRFTRRERGT